MLLACWVRQSVFCQTNAVVIRGASGALLVDAGVDGSDPSELAALSAVVTTGSRPIPGIGFVRGGLAPGVLPARRDVLQSLGIYVGQLLAGPGGARKCLPGAPSCCATSCLIISIWTARQSTGAATTGLPIDVPPG